MTEDLQPADANDSKGKPKVLIAAAIAGVMLIMSLSIAAVTAWYLLLGDQGNAVQNTLPSDCEWLLENHEGGLFDLVVTAANRDELAQLPHPASVVMAGARAWRDVAVPALKDAADDLPLATGVGLCGRKNALLLTMPLGEDNPDGPKTVMEMVRNHLGTGQWAVSDPVDRFTERTLLRGGRNVASILHTDVQAVVALTAGPGFTGREQLDASKAQAEAVLQNRTASMRSNLHYREGRERVGGTERLWIGKVALDRLAKRYLSAELQGYTDAANWLAGSLRTEAGDLHVHIHLGGSERLFVYATERLAQDGELPLSPRVSGIKGHYYVVDKGVVLTFVLAGAVAGSGAP